MPKITKAYCFTASQFCSPKSEVEIRWNKSIKSFFPNFYWWMLQFSGENRYFTILTRLLKFFTSCRWKIDFTEVLTDSKSHSHSLPTSCLSHHLLQVNSEFQNIRVVLLLLVKLTVSCRIQ